MRIKIENSTINVAGRLMIDDVSIYDMTPTNPLAATPAILIATGKYYSSQNVVITSTTPSTSFYYNTDGTIPTNAVYSSRCCKLISDN